MCFAAMCCTDTVVAYLQLFPTGNKRSPEIVRVSTSFSFCSFGRYSCKISDVALQYFLRTLMQRDRVMEAAQLCAVVGLL